MFKINSMSAIKHSFSDIDFLFVDMLHVASVQFWVPPSQLSDHESWSDSCKGFLSVPNSCWRWNHNCMSLYKWSKKNWILKPSCCIILRFFPQLKSKFRMTSYIAHAVCNCTKYVRKRVVVLVRRAARNKIEAVYYTRSIQRGRIFEKKIPKGNQSPINFWRKRLTRTIW